MIKKLFLVVLVIAAFLRLYKLGSVPATMYIDEVAIGADARSIAQTGKDMHGNSMFTTMFPSYGDYKLPVYVWLAAASVKTLGPTQFAVRLPSAVAGIATVALTYALATELFDREKKKRWIALSVAAVTALMPWSILFSRTGFEGHVGQALLLTALLFALYARRNPRWYIGMAVVGALAVYTYFSVRFVLPVVLVASILCWHDLKRMKTTLLWMLGSAFLCVLLVIPLFTSRYRGPSEQLRLSTENVLTSTAPAERSQMLKSVDVQSLESKVFHTTKFYLVKNIARNISAHLDLSYLFLHGDANLRHSTGHVGLMLLAFAPCFFVGLYTLAKRYPRVGVFLLIWFFISLVPASIPVEVPHALRSLNGVGVLCIVCGAGLYELVLWFAHKRQGFIGRLILFGLITAIVVNVIAFQYDYYVHYPLRSQEAWYAYERQLETFVEKHNNNDLHIYVNAPNDKFFLWFLFYGNYDFSEVQKMPSSGYIFSTIGKVVFSQQSKMNIELAEPNTIYVGLRGDTQSKSLQTEQFSQGQDIRYILNP